MAFGTLIISESEIYLPNTYIAINWKNKQTARTIIQVRAA